MFTQLGTFGISVFKNMQLTGFTGDIRERICTHLLAVTDMFWLEIMLIVIVSLLVIGLYFWRISLLKRQKKELEATIDDHTKELRKANAELEEKQEEIIKQNEEISSMNEQLTSKNKEIEYRNSEISAINEKLVEKNKEIETHRNEIIKQKNELERSYDNLKILGELGLKITSTLDFEKINDILFDYVNSLMDTVAFGIGICDEKRNIIIYEGFKERGKVVPTFYKELDDKLSLSVWCVNNKKRVFIRNIEEEYKQYVETLVDFEIDYVPYSIIQMPLVIEDKVIGVITINTDKIGAYGENDINILQSLAGYVSIALSNSRAYKDLQKRSQLIKGSIRAARIIQNSILPPMSKIENYFKAFVMYRPKDIVSGDFYWLSEVNGKVYFAVVDCTGHGVPGAFMTLIGSRILDEIVRERQIKNPADILEMLDDEIVRALHKEEKWNYEGMDICLVQFEGLLSRKERREKSQGKVKVTFCGAKRPLYYSKDGSKVQIIRGNNTSIGGILSGKTEKTFTSEEIQLEEGDIVYLTTDGFVDQHNRKRQKFGEKQLIQVLNYDRLMTIEDQEERLTMFFEEHQQRETQRDDITIVGLCV
jgi:serine phosphatase RsbU (regulator of sigma subunit)